MITQGGIDPTVIQGIADSVAIATALEGGGNVTVGVAQVEITFTGTTTSIVLRADDSNAGVIYIGETGVLADGTNHFIALWAGDEVVLDFDDIVTGIYAIASEASQVVSKGALL